MDAKTYNGFFTLHGITMIFLIVIPGIPATLGNFFLPIMIGAKDVAFPRINLLSWWIYIFGAAVAISSQFLGNGPPDTGWTFYAPYSFKTSTDMLPAVLGAFILGFSSILTGLNFIVTIHRMRAPGMNWLRMDSTVGNTYCWYYIVNGCCRTHPSHRLFRSYTGWRSSIVSAFVLDLFTSGSIYYDTSCDGSDIGNTPDIRPQADFRV